MQIPERPYLGTGAFRLRPHAQKQGRHGYTRGRACRPKSAKKASRFSFVALPALAEIEAEQAHIARPIEFAQLFYFALRTPGTAWPTDQNGKLPKYLKGILHAATRSQFLEWLAATQSILCVDCGEHCYPNCITHPKKCSRRNRRKRYEQPASALADPQNQTRFTLTHSDRLFVLETYRPIFEKVRRKRKPRTSFGSVPISPPLEPAA